MLSGPGYAKKSGKI